MIREKRPKSYTASRQSEVAALASPVRLQIVNIMEQKPLWSVGEIADVMGRKPETLYYQIQLLQRVGLVVKGSSRQTKRHDEALYSLKARQIMIDRKCNTPGFVEEIVRTGRSIVRLFERQLSAALRSRQTRRSGKYRNFRQHQYMLHLSKEQLGEFNKRVDKLQEFLDEHHACESGDQYSILIGLVEAPSAKNKLRRAGRSFVTKAEG